MNKQERYKKIIDLISEIDKINDTLYNIVWEPQEGDFENHFDNLQKADRVAIIGLLNDANRLSNSIASYSHWFEQK